MGLVSIVPSRAALESGVTVENKAEEVSALTEFIVYG